MSVSPRALRFDREVARLWGTMSPREIAEAVGGGVATMNNAAAVIVLDAVQAVIGDLGISRKWAALDTARAALAAHQTKGAP